MTRSSPKTSSTHQTCVVPCGVNDHEAIPFITKCKLCGDVLLTPKELDDVLNNKTLIQKMVNAVTKGLQGRQINKIKKKFSDPIHIAGQTIKGSVTGHLTRKHKIWSVKNMPKVKGGKKSLRAIDKAIEFNNKEVIRYGGEKWEI